MTCNTLNLGVLSKIPPSISWSTSLAFLALCAAACLAPAPARCGMPSAEKKVPCAIAAEDRAVYATVLKDADVWKLPVNSESTGAFTLTPHRDEWKRAKGPLGSAAERLVLQASAETRDDFAAKSTSGCYIGVLPQKDLERPSGLESRPDERHPKETYWYGTVNLSRVGFNSEKTEALVYTERSCGPDCGGGDFFLLRKKDGAWTVVAQINLWEL